MCFDSFTVKKKQKHDFCKVLLYTTLKLLVQCSCSYWCKQVASWLVGKSGAFKCIEWQNHRKEFRRHFFFIKHIQQHFPNRKFQRKNKQVKITMSRAIEKRLISAMYAPQMRPHQLCFVKVQHASSLFHLRHSCQWSNCWQYIGHLIPLRADH